MEDDDLAVVNNGALTIHRTQHGEVSGQSAIREIHELKIELQQIMKGTSLLWNIYFKCRLFCSQEIINISCKKKSTNNPNQLLTRCVAV